MTCTVAMATGLTSLIGNLLGQSHDCGFQQGWHTLRVQLVIPEAGNRYLRTCGPYDDNLMPILSEKGIAVTGFARPAPDFPPYPGKPKRITEDELMRTSNSACEYVNTWSKNMTQYGTSGFMGASSIGRMAVDTKEGYMYEGANWVYGDPANHAIHGPMTDQVFACGNFFVNSILREKAQTGIGMGYNRAKRVWELLVDRQYDCFVEETPPHKGRETMPYFGAGISLPYFMSIFRDHGNLQPDEGRMSNYVPEERGREAVCFHGIVWYTKCAVISNVVENHTDLFSCLWMTFGQPCSSPFLPVYIGVNALPKDITVGGNSVAKVFEDLRLALEYRPNYAEEIKRYWTVFEIQTIEESYQVETAAARSADNGDTDGARKILTDFIENKWAKATSLGYQWLNIFKDLPTTGRFDRT